METLKIIAVNAGYCITIISLLTALIKPLRAKLIDFIIHQRQQEEQEQKIEKLISIVEELQVSIEEINNELIAHTEALQGTIRNIITRLYYQYINEGSIPELDKENVGRLYEIYSTQLHGNTYVHECYEQLMALPTK